VSDRSGRPAGRNRGKPTDGGGGATTTKPTKPEKGKWSTGWRRWAKWIGIVGGSVFAIGLVLFAVAYARTDIPDPNEGFETQTSFVYYADGKTVLGKFADQNRISVDLSEVPQHVQDAVIAAEDRTFWTNKGIDPRGIVRAAFNNVGGGDTQGASTITQQYVKVFYLSQERTWSRKVKEAILSLKVQRQMSKEEVLQGYLNTIYFGRGAYGIDAAARAYFGVPASELTVQQGAALAAIINSPNGYDPANGRAAKQDLKDRYTYVIDSMNDMGTLPAKLASSSKVYRLPQFPPYTRQSSNAGQRGHVMQMVRAELERLGYSDSEIDGGGLRVTTTFTRTAMAAAREGVAQERPDLKDLHVAVASVDPETGALRGMYAGQDYLDSQINWAVEGGAPGSTFKPFSLATGLTYGYALESVFDGSSPQEIAGAEFSNQGEGGGVSYGDISLLTATENSVNTAYVNLVDSMPDGVNQVIDTASAMGIPRDAPGLDPSLSIVLGSATISPIDMANAYGTIAAGGVAKDAFLIESVRSTQGGRTYTHREDTTQAISEEVAADTSYALQQVTSVGTGTAANVIGRPVAGKTGTATTDGGHVRSSWFVGYTPQLATAVMYSRGNGNEPLDGYLDTFYGGEHPADTWAAVMSRALAGAEVLPFPEPAFIDQTAEGHSPTPTPTPTPSPTRTDGSGQDGQGEDEEPDEEPSEEASPSDEGTPSDTATPPDDGELEVPDDGDEGAPGERRGRSRGRE